MLIETERLYMRPLRPSDVGALYRLHSDPLVVRLTTNGTAMSIGQSEERLALYLREWQEYGFGFFIVYEKQMNGDLIFAGRSGLRMLDEKNVEIGYSFTTQASGKGLATEAAAQVVHFAFSRCGLDGLVALVRPSNLQSARILQKLGFTYTKMTLQRKVQYKFYELQAPAKIRFYP
jgi:ribosomal-protein-alanine N-acetyltransferase